MSHFSRIAVGMMLVAFQTTAFAAVEIYPFPASVPTSSKYSVTIYDDSNCGVYTPTALYSEPNLDIGPDGSNGVTGMMQDRSMTYVPFAFTGEVEIEATKLFGAPADRVEVSPKSYGIEPTYFDGTTVRFRLNHSNLPAYVSVNFVSDDNRDPGKNSAMAVKNALMIFGDQPETNAPDLTNAVDYTTATRSQIENADLIYFPPGDHDLINKFGLVDGKAGTDARIFLSKDGQHVHLAAGAFVRGSIDGHIEAEGRSLEYLKLTGRGVISGQDYPWHYFRRYKLDGTEKPVTFLRYIGKFLEVDGPIVEGPTHHTLPGGANATMKNFKIIGWASNHDGIRIGNGSAAEQLFMKTSDDLDYARLNQTLKDSVLWPMRNGAMGQLGWNDNVGGGSTFQNIHLIHCEWDEDAAIKKNVGVLGSRLVAGANISNNLVENIQGEWGTGMLANLTITFDPNKGWQTPQGGSWGEIHNITYKNVILEGAFENEGGVHVKNLIRGFEQDGAKAEVHDITFTNVVAGNELLTSANAGNYIDIDPNTTYNIVFNTEGNIYNVTTSSNAGGTLRPSGTLPTPAGMDRFITVIPNAGKKISDVKIDGVSVGRKQNVFLPNVQANHTVEVTFANAGNDHFGSAYSCSAGTPVAPSNVVATPACDQVALSWQDNSNNEDSFEIRRRPAGGGTATTAGTVGANVTSFVDTSVTESTAYDYKVRAANASGMAGSGWVNATTTACGGGDNPPGAPAKPTNLVATAGDSQVSLDWDDNTEADFSHYIVRRNLTGVGPWGAAIATPTSSNYVDTSAVNGTTYYYAIRAEDTSANKSNNGNVESATPSAGGLSIPAQIEAENYDAFNDTTAGNAGDPSCSSTDVDAETTSDTGGGCNVGWTVGGEWLEYDISSSGGTFDIVLRLASNKSGKTVTVKLNGNPVGTVTSPNTGWQSWDNRMISNVSIPAGGHTIRIEFDNGNVNFNYLDIQ